MKLDEIKELMKLFGKSKLGKIKIRQKDFEIEMVKESGTIVAKAAPKALTVTTESSAVPVATVSTISTVESEKVSGETITSPVIGTYYASPSPDSPAFVQVGDTVEKGTVLCILEAMKIMNELKAEYDCKILDILVNDGDPVEYDKPLFIIEKM
ncbi:MAG: acetyl-CoA carboxylase biotin carboxyl carrier protein [Campylobacterota bacterium]|nr:acetyl-CoA carboxylase biotin carboxyl carrier protein [Campylobacterota bacterium]